MASWQQKCISNRERLVHILNNGDLSDVTFIVGNSPKYKKEFKLHKFILSLCSDVFYTMFHGSLPETDIVEVPDIEPPVFQVLIKYMYEEAFTVSSFPAALLTYCAAEKYNIADLRNKCIVYINDNLIHRNIPILYKMPHVIEALHIKLKCQEIISYDTTEILNSVEFHNAPLNMMMEMMQMDILSIKSEEKLFEYLLKWAKSTCNRQDVDALRRKIDPLLPYVRFLAMKLEDFISVLGNSNILTDSEVASISKNLVSFGICELPSWCNKEKSTRNTWKLLQFYDNHICIKYHSGNSLCNCELVIITDKIKLKVVNIYAIPGNTSEIASAEFTLRNNQLLLYSTSESSYDRKTGLLKFTLATPVLLQRGRYNMSINAKSCTTFHSCPISQSTVKRFLNTEIEYLAKDGISYGYYSHLHEIIYTD